MNLIKVLLFFLCVFSALSCSEDDTNGEIQNIKFESSLKNWKTLTKENGTSYSYEVNFSSFAGFSSKTILTITNGIVTKRSFTSYSIFDSEGKQLPNGEKREIESYIEDESNLGMNLSGAKVLTIDELYETCAKDVLTVSQEKNKIIFNVSENGLIQTCIYIPKDCQDDCSMGVLILNLKWIK